jgi:hypothetical protein
MIIGSEAQGHGIQIFDMKKLLDLDPASPVTFSNEKDLVGHYKGLPVGRTYETLIQELHVGHILTSYTIT